MKLEPIEVATAIIAIEMPLANSNSNLTNPLDQTKTLLANYQI